MISHETYMQRCIELAEKGKGSVAPNPLVGCVILCDNKIIGEGWHHKYGEAHAEVNAIASVENKELLQRATLYVNLEPCVHFGKTAPCTDLIIRHKIPHVVIGCLDSFSLVDGKGKQKLSQSGIQVESGILEKECRFLNRRFFTFHEKKRPYIILKWAETADGFIDKTRSSGSEEKAMQISSPESRKMLHQWRAEESAILIGTNTALLDNPQLTVRGVSGNNPLRLVLDQHNKIPLGHHLKDGSTPTLIFSSLRLKNEINLEYVQISFGSSTETLNAVLAELHKRNIQSVLVEGGAMLLNAFFDLGAWDETRVFMAALKAGSGVKAPNKPDLPFSSENVGGDELRIYTKGT